MLSAEFNDNFRAQSVDALTKGRYCYSYKKRQPKVTFCMPENSSCKIIKKINKIKNFTVFLKKCYYGSRWESADYP